MKTSVFLGEGFSVNVDCETLKDVRDFWLEMRRQADQKLDKLQRWGVQLPSSHTQPDDEECTPLQRAAGYWNSYSTHDNKG